MINDSEMTTDEKIDRINSRLDELFTAILGDKTFGSPGYRQRIESNEESILEHERRMNRIDDRFTKVYQRVIGIAVGVTIAASVIGWVIQNSVQETQAKPIPAIERIDPVPLSSSSQVIPDLTGKLAPEDSTNE